MRNKRLDRTRRDCHPNATGSERVDARRAHVVEHALARKVRVAVVVGEDDDQVGPGGEGRTSRKGEKCDEGCFQNVHGRGYPARECVAAMFPFLRLTVKGAARRVEGLNRIGGRW